MIHSFCVDSFNAWYDGESASQNADTVASRHGFARCNLLVIVPLGMLCNGSETTNLWYWLRPTHCGPRWIDSEVCYNYQITLSFEVLVDHKIHPAARAIRNGCENRRNTIVKQTQHVLERQGCGGRPPCAPSTRFPARAAPRKDGCPAGEAARSGERLKEACLCIARIYKKFKFFVDCCNFFLEGFFHSSFF